jgi:acid phosphatase class B
VFSTQEGLDIAKQAELEVVQRKPKKNAKQQAKTMTIEDVEEEAVEIVYSDSDSDCIAVAAPRSS